MRIDITYIKELLDIILDHDSPDFNINHPKIAPLWHEDGEPLNKFVFHMEILEDQDLIESSTKNPGLGFKRFSNGEYGVSVIPLRLTADGHQFAADLNKPGVLEQLRTTFKDLGPAETVKIAFRLAGKATDKLLSKYLDDD